MSLSGLAFDTPLIPGLSGHADALKLEAQARKLEELNSLFEVALNNMARGLSMFDAEKRLIVCNSLYREIYDLPEAMTRPGTSFNELVAYYVNRQSGRADAPDAASQAAWICEHMAQLAQGKTFSQTQTLRDGRIILVTIQPLADGGWVDIQEDVTEKTRASERIEWLATHCALTGLANRFQICERIDRALRAQASAQKVAVHLIDLDRFKAVNDTHGHATGDALLKVVAKRLKSTLRADDIAGRLGGDEFAIVQTNISSPDQVEGLAARVVKVLNEPYRVQGHALNVGASIGISVSPDNGDGRDDLLKKADVALYGVKAKGRGAFSLFQGTTLDADAQPVRLEQALGSALQNNEISLHYQPIINLETRSVTGCEALMRWTHPVLGHVAPGSFIPVAERSGTIVELGAWALRQACRDAASWGNDLRVTVNVSAVQFERGELVADVERALTESGLAPKRLELEITESVLLRSEERNVAILDRLREMGVRIALDDFGTAFASLSYLTRFRFDKIKIDRSFVRDISQRKDCAAIVKAVADLASALDIQSVAEGVETGEQLDGARLAGCHEVQGYYFSQPMPIERMSAVFEDCRVMLAAS